MVFKQGYILSSYVLSHGYLRRTRQKKDIILIKVGNYLVLFGNQISEARDVIINSGYI